MKACALSLLKIVFTHMTNFIFAFHKNYEPVKIYKTEADLVSKPASSASSKIFNKNLNLVPV